MTYVIKIIDNQMYLCDPTDIYNPIKQFNQPHLFDGDIVTPILTDITKYELISSPISNSVLVGYFSTSQQVKFGKTSSGSTIYQVSTFNPVLPHFLISYGGKLKGKLLITFAFKEWVNALPKGEIIQVLGLMDDSNLITSLQYISGIYRKEIKNKLTKNTYEDRINRKEILDYVFSIDPVGCVDIDDAISYVESADEYTIRIHIAQPIYWLNEECMIARAKCAFSTLYQQPHKTNSNLWGDEITKQSSLLAGVKRPSYTMEFIVDKKTNKIIWFGHYPSYITNSCATNYDDCCQNSIINNFYSITKCISANEKMDTHELVSYWMIMANNYLGESDQIKSLSIPYRVTNITDNKIKIFNDIQDDQDGLVSMAFYNMTMDSAVYAIRSENNYHSGLNKNNYIHFTSPIRRMIDTLIHWCLTYNINFVDLISRSNLDLNCINNLDKKTKKFHQQINLLGKIDMLFATDSDKQIADSTKPIKINGWIYNKTGNRWTIYFKELGFIRVKMWDFKFNYLVDNLVKEKINEKKIGEKMSFFVNKTPGFMPKEKILIVSSLNLL